LDARRGEGQIAAIDIIDHDREAEKNQRWREGWLPRNFGVRRRSWGHWRDYPCWARRGKNDLRRAKILTEASKVAVSLTGFGVRVSIDFRLRKTEWTPPQLL
jgi:hypothetical protein